MEKRPSNEDFAAAVGEPRSKIDKLGGGPYLYQLVIGKQAYQVIAIDGRVWRRSLPALGRYLQGIALLDHKQMQLDELIGLIETYGEPPSGFGWILSLRTSPYGPPPALTYDADAATLVLYELEAEPRAGFGFGPGGPQIVGISPPIWLRATLNICRDYRLKWQTDRYNASTKQWEPR